MIQIKVAIPTTPIIAAIIPQFEKARLMNLLSAPLLAAAWDCDDIDITRAARTMIDNHGTDAVLRAIAIANECYLLGDLVGHSKAMRVVERIGSLFHQDNHEE